MIYNIKSNMLHIDKKISIDVREFDNNIIHCIHEYTPRDNESGYEYTKYIEYIRSVPFNISFEKIVFIGIHSRRFILENSKLNNEKIVNSYLIGYVDKHIYKTITFDIDPTNIDARILKHLLSTLTSMINTVKRRHNKYNNNTCCTYHGTTNLLNKNGYTVYIINKCLLSIYIHDIINMFPRYVSHKFFITFIDANGTINTNHFNDKIELVIEYPIFMLIRSFYMTNIDKINDDAFINASIAVENHHNLVKFNTDWRPVYLLSIIE